MNWLPSFGSGRERPQRHRPGDIRTDLDPSDPATTAEEYDEYMMGEGDGSEGEQDVPEDMTKKPATVKDQKKALSEMWRKDQNARDKAPDRWKPDISPEDEAFKTVLSTFDQALKNKSSTIDSILKQSFSPYERDLLMPVDRRSNLALARIQAENKQRYRDLLNSPRFKDYQHRADLAFKFTLLHFGLPVSPMVVDYYQQWSGVEELSDDEDMEIDDLARSRLRFLNRHQKRVYERDSLRVPDPTLESYYAYDGVQTVGSKESLARFRRNTNSLGLRGGGGDEDNNRNDHIEGHDSDHDASSESDSLLTPSSDDPMDLSGEEPSAPGRASSDSDLPILRGGIIPAKMGSGFDAIYGSVSPSSIAHQDTDSFRRGLETTLTGGPEPARGLDRQWIPLYGYQGIVWFQVGTFNTFVDAVIRLLTGDRWLGVNYNLYLLDKDVDYVHDEAARKRFLEDTSGNNGITIIEAAGADDYRVPRDLPAWEWLSERLSVMAASGIDVHSKVFFIAGLTDEMPWTWQPNPGADVMKLMLEWKFDGPSGWAWTLERPDVAYIRMPHNAIDVGYSNYFAPWLARACRVLVVGHLPRRPGRPEVPDAFISAKFDDAAVGSYGGLAFSPRIWRSMVQRYQADPQRPIVLRARRGGVFSDAISVFLPGGGLSPAVGLKYESLLPHREETWDKRQKRLLKPFKSWVTKLMEESMSMDPKTLRKVKGLEIQSPSESHFYSRPRAKTPPTAITPFPARTPPTEITPRTIEIENMRVKHDSEASQILDLLSEMLDYTPYELRRGWGDDPVRLLSRWSRWPVTLGPFSMVILPVFSEYTIRSVESESSSQPWDPAKTTMHEFRELLAKMFGSRWRDSKTWFIIQQGRYWMDEAHELHGIRPKLAISPYTSEREWSFIRRSIVEPDIYVSLAAEEDVRPQFGPRKGDYEIDYWRQGFGYRETEEVPEDSLFLAFTMPHFRHYEEDHTLKKEWRLLSDLGFDHREVELRSKIFPLDKHLPEEPSNETSKRALVLPQLTDPNASKQGVPGVARATRASVRAAAAVVEGDKMEDAPDNAVSDSSDDYAREPIASSIPPVKEIPGRSLNRFPPVRQSRTMSSIEAAMRTREFSYTYPLDVQMGKAFPINAPPIDQLLNSGRDSLPAVSLAVLTPSEARRLQNDYFDLRTLILGRTQRCPYAGCNSVFPVNKTADMQQHLLEAHAAEKCNFCDELLFRHWTPQQRRQHIASEHGDLINNLDKFVDLGLTSVGKTTGTGGRTTGPTATAEKPAVFGVGLGVDKAPGTGSGGTTAPPVTPQTPGAKAGKKPSRKPAVSTGAAVPVDKGVGAPPPQPKGRTVFSREKHWNFCSRCSRNHRILAASPDRLQHDSICYPGVSEDDRWEACTVCGGHKPAGAPASYKHKHREGFEEFQPYCALCALPLGLSTRDDADTHTQNCCGYGSDPARFCPWCARTLKPGIEQRKKHIEGCEKRPAPSELHGPLEGPINVDTNEYYPAAEGSPPPSGDEGSGDSEAEFEPQVDEAAGKKEGTFRPAKRKPARKKAPASRVSTRATRNSPPVPAATAKSAIFRPTASSLASSSKRKFDNSGPETRSKRAARTVHFADYPDAFDYSSTSSSGPEPIRREESGHPLTPGMSRGVRSARRLGVRL
ncbi:hypothetical protein B0T19DRAFT_297554 [Cercophora scortea]|uniref:Uncharacterized protein n=1 Tax=Cercophora scortea TaxID=314031 RepID=A0AAE0M4P1_9PEZI|nr:hypothetical protein B0T19DRAFT_297554 [Cercophora scortea]